MKKIYEIEVSDKIRQVICYQFYKLYEQGKVDWADIAESAINEKHPRFLEDNNFDKVDLKFLIDFISIERRYDKQQFSSLFSKDKKVFCFFDGTVDELLNIEDIKGFPLIFTGYQLSPFNSLVNIEYYHSNFIFNIDGEDMNLSASPNLYDDGYCSIEFIDHEKFIIEYYDENNGNAIDIFNYTNGCISKLEEIDSVKLLENLYKKNIKWAMWQLSDSLLKNRDAILLSLKVDKDSIYHYIESLSGNLLTDREIVYELVSIDGNTLKFASEQIKNDKEIFLAAIKNNYLAVQYCPNSLINDKEFMLDVFRINEKIKDFIEDGKIKLEVNFENSINDTHSKLNKNDMDLPF